MCSLHVDRHLPEMMLDVRIINFALCLYVLQGVFVSSLRRPQKSRRVMRDETRLPPLLEILTGVADEIGIRNERTTKMDQVTYGGPHSDRIPPRAVDLHCRVGKIAGHQQLRIQRCVCMANSAGAGSVDQENRPLGSAGTGRKHFVAIDYVTAVDSLERGTKPNCFARLAGLRLADPSHPFV